MTGVASLAPARLLIAYGLAMGGMNFLFYTSISRIPLGIAVALEFTGPLAVAMAASRRPVDFIWIVLASLGLAILLPLGHQSQPLSPTGILCALGAAVCWAMYIVFGQKLGNAHSGQTAAVGTVIGALFIVPVGVAQAPVQRQQGGWAQEFHLDLFGDAVQRIQQGRGDGARVDKTGPIRPAHHHQNVHGRLKGLDRELKIPIICLAQLNRQMEQGKEGHRPKLSHLRESGAIEQDADVVMFVHREEYYHAREEAMEKGIAGQAEIIVGKQRNGPTGDVKLAWLSQFTRFENLSQKPYEEFGGYQEDF